MRHVLATNALLALAVLTTSARAQPQPDAAPKKGAPAQPTVPKADPTDAAIAAALANDSDVKIARAKIQLAEAELAKARQTVTLKVVTLKTKIDQLKTEVTVAEDRVVFVDRLVRGNTASASELLAERAKLETAKGALALAEAEWKLLTESPNPAGGAAANPTPADALPMALWMLADKRGQADRQALLLYARALDLANREWVAVRGPVPDRIRTALDKPVKLGPKGTKVTFAQALEVFKKEAGLDVPVRGGYPMYLFFDRDRPKSAGPVRSEPIEIVSEGEELSVGAWFQLFEDYAGTSLPDGTPARFRFYVREYGLLIAPTAAAPPDAPTLNDFWKGKAAAKETAPEPAPKK